jgi:penicillin-binding protein 2
MAYAPANKPTIAIALIVENAGWGGSVAAPIARKIFDAWLLRHPSGATPEQKKPVASDSAWPKLDLSARTVSDNLIRPTSETSANPVAEGAPRLSGSGG